MFLGLDSHFVVSVTLPDVLSSLCRSSVNYCFESRAKSCSECLQAGIGCAYCPDEVREENDKNSIQICRWWFRNKVVIIFSFNGVLTGAFSAVLVFLKVGFW